jgi:tetratricopeptide (TPR) repeat protein
VEHALACAPDHVEAHELRGTALLGCRRFSEALAAADAWITLAPGDGRAHHARGKALIGLGRPVDARAAFERASALSPQRLEAMLLRREVDRMTGTARVAVGSALPLTLDIPAHLGELRDALAGGRTVDAIALLQRPEYSRDAVAQRLLGELLAHDARFADALSAFDAALVLDDTIHQAPAARLGKASALLGLGRANDALALFDGVIADHSELHEAFAGRARALVALGRTAEAETALQRYVALTGRLSELRVRMARDGR